VKGGTTKHRGEAPEESQVVRLIHPKPEPVPMPSDTGAGEIVRRCGFLSAWTARLPLAFIRPPTAPCEVRLNGFLGALAEAPRYRINSLPYGNVGNGLFPTRLRALPTPLLGLTCMSVVTEQFEVSPRRVPRCQCVPARGGSQSQEGSEEGSRR